MSLEHAHKLSATEALLAGLPIGRQPLKQLSRGIVPIGFQDNCARRDLRQPGDHALSVRLDMVKEPNQKCPVPPSSFFILVRRQIYREESDISGTRSRGRAV